jgi:UDP-N-acetylmuramate dehydrogenase
MIEIKKNIPLAPYTTFKIGGPAKYFAEAKSVEEIEELCRWAKKEKVPIFALGGGSHVLISDKGFGGLVIKIKNSNFKFRNSELYADAGVSLAKIVAETAGKGLSGLEWAIGIPGTVGGAVCDNSGAYGKEIADIFESAEVFDLKKMSVCEFKREDCSFRYRESIFKNNSDLIIVSAIIKLEKGGDPPKIKETMKNYAKDRMKSGRSTDKSAGCYFKNIEWSREDIDKNGLLKKFPELKQFKDKPKIAVGFLIDSLGFKGKRIGDAVVSEQHAGFLVNCGGATADDVLALASLIKKKICEYYGFNLEEEVVII